MATSPLKIFIRPEKRFVAERRPTELMVLLRIVPSTPAPGYEPMRANVGLVLDVGRGLADPAQRAIRERAAQLVERMGPHDRVQVTFVGDGVRTVDDTDGRRPLLDALRGEGVPGGDTPLYHGWVGAGLALGERWDRSAVNRLFVVSDGTAPIGDDGETFVRSARGLFRRGISTSTLGIGATFEEDPMVAVALQGGGGAWFAENLEGIGEPFTRETESLRSVYTEWATLRFDVDNADVVDILNDLPWVADSKIALPPLYDGAPLHILARLRLRPDGAGEDMVPLTARIKTLDLDCQHATVHKKGMRVHVVSPALADSMEPDLAVQAHAARLQLAGSHQRCITAIDQGDLKGARDLLDFALTRFRKLSGHAGGTLLTRDLHAMMRVREHLLDPSYTALNRKLFKYIAAGAVRSDLVGG